MRTFIRIQGVLIYFYVVLYGISAIIGLFTAMSGIDSTSLGLAVIFAPIAYLLHLLAQGHFRLARQGDNYIKFCKVHGINDDKEHSEEFFRQFKKESK